jgi:hypothetical protein
MRLATEATAELNGSFRDWISSIGEDTDAETLGTAWNATARDTLGRLSYRRALSAGPNAAAGRDVDTAYLWSTDRKTGISGLRFSSVGQIPMSSGRALDHYALSLAMRFGKKEPRA